MSELVLPAPGIWLPGPSGCREWLDTTTRRGKDRFRRWQEAREASRDTVLEAVALDAALGTGNNTSSTTCTMSTTAAVASGAHVIVVVGWFINSTSTSTLSGGGLTWTKDAELRAGSLHIAIHRAPAPSGLASSTTLTATFSLAGDSIMGAGSFLGIDTTGTAIASATNNGSTAGWGSGAVASTSGNALIGGSFIDNGATTSSSPTSPGVELFDTNVAGQSETLTSVYKLSVAGSDSIDGTWNAAGAWIAAAVCYKAAGAATKAPPPRRQLVNAWSF